MSFGGTSGRPFLHALRTVFRPTEEGFRMRRLLIVLVLLMVVVAGVGYYLGWYHVSTGGEDGKNTPSITVDQGKIEADKEKAKEKAQDLGEKVKEKVNAAGDKGKEENPRP